MIKNVHGKTLRIPDFIAGKLRQRPDSEFAAFDAEGPVGFFEEAHHRFKIILLRARPGKRSRNRMKTRETYGFREPRRVYNNPRCSKIARVTASRARLSSGFIMAMLVAKK